MRCPSQGPICARHSCAARATRWRCRAFRNALGRALVIGGIRHPHMAVVQNGIVRAVSLIDLVERLRDEEAADAVASHKGERRLKEIQPAECRELIEHQQQFALALDAIGTIKRLGEPAADLVEDQAHEWLGAAYVRRRHHQVQRHRPFSGNQIGDAPVAARRDCGYSGVAVEAQERHGGGQHARPLVVRLVQHFPRGGCDNRVRCIAQVLRRHHPVQR